MADRTVGSLPKAPDLYDDSLLVVEQQGAAASITGKQIKQFARAGVKDYVEDAKKAADTALEAVEKVGTSAEEAKAAQEAAQTAQKGAEAAQKAIEDMEVSSVTLPAGSPASVEKTSKDGYVLLKLGLPRGPAGPQGIPGSQITGIERTGGNGSPGTVDTYTITLSDGGAYEIHVYNGADGKGAGDMTAMVYDPSGKTQDIFAYADKAAEALLPVIHTAALSASAWTAAAGSYSQAVTVPGVLEDPARQIIQPVPADAGSLARWNACGVLCAAQGDGTLTFSARDRPETDILLQIAVQAARSYEGGTKT